MTFDPMLDALANNGGPTMTMALQPGSPAFNAGSNALAVDSSNAPLTTDQRGGTFNRIAAVHVDIGAFEIQTAESLVVTTTADEDDRTSDPSFGTGTSLREAVNYANSLTGSHTITFDPSLAGKTISLGFDGDDTYGPSALVVTGNVTISGLGGSSGVTIDRDTTAAPDRLRLFYVASGGTLTLQDLTLSGGLAKGGSSVGGGGGAGLGGAIVDAGTLNVLRCTLTGNQAIGGSSTANSGGNESKGGGGGLGGDAEGRAGGPPNGSPTFHINGGFGGGGFAGIGSAASDGGFGGGGGEGIVGGDATSGKGGFGAGAGGPNGTGADGGFGGGDSGSTNQQGGGGGGLGGAIFSNGGTVNIINSTFTANSAIGGTGADNGKGLGGAVFNRDGTLNITNSTLSADIANQGGLEVYTLGDGDHSGSDPVTANSASATINNSILAQAIDPDADMVNPDFVSNTNDSGTSTSAGTNDLFNATSGFGGTNTTTIDPKLGSTQQQRRDDDDDGFADRQSSRK